MPFKMMNPLKKMDTAAMKTVQKSAMKLKDLNNDGKTTKADLLIKKGVYNKDGSPKKKASGVNYMNESKSPVKVAKKGDLIGQVVGDVSDIASSVSNMLKKAKDDFYKQREERLEKARTQEEKDKVLKNLPNSKLAETLEKIRRENEIKKPTSDKKSTTKDAGGEGGGSSNTTGKKPTYSQAWEKMTDAAKGKYKSKADFIKAAKAYNNRGKTGATTETETETGTAGLTEAEKKAAEQKKLKEAAEQKKLKKEKEAADNSDKIVKEAQLEKAKKEAEKAAAEKIRLAKAEEYNKKNLKPRSRSRRKVKVDVVKDKKTGARLKTKTRTRKDGTVKTKVKETRIIGGVASKTRKVEDAKKGKRKKDRNKNRSRVSVGSSPG